MSWRVAWEVVRKVGGWGTNNWQAVLLAVVVLGWARACGEARQERAARVGAEFRLEAAEVAADSSREVLAGVLAEHVRYYQRRVHQVRELALDSVDRALREESRVRGEFVVQVPETEVTAEGGLADVREEESVRVGTFRVQKPPYHIWAQALLPSPGDSIPPELRLRIGLDPVKVGVRIACGDAPEGREVRPALATVRVQRPYEAEVVAVQSVWEVCNAEAAGVARRGSGGAGVGSVLAGGVVGGVSGWAAGGDVEGAATGAVAGVATGWLIRQGARVVKGVFR